MLHRSQNNFQQPVHGVVDDPVEDLPPLLARIDQARFTQDHQLLGNVGLTFVCSRLHMAHTDLSLP